MLLYRRGGSMTINERRTLHAFICNGNRCSDCPIDKYAPCDTMTPDADLLRYARIKLRGKELPKVSKIVKDLSKVVVC